MNRLISSAAAMSLFILVAASAADAANTSLDGVIETAQQSISTGQSKRAESALKKALATAAADGTKDASFARAQVLYATALRQSGKFADASEALVEAYATYKALGSVDPAYIEELKVLAPNFQSIELDVLRGAANSLKNNSAKVTMEKTGSGAHVEIKMPTPLENSLNNAKIDGVQLDKLVYFDIESSDPNSIHLSNIKGFHIHSVEKNTWVNLIDLKTGAPDAEGKYDATIVAGKAGITKTVPAKLPLKAAEPILGLAEQLQKFGAVPQIDLPIAVATPASAPAAVVPAVTTPVVIDTAVTTPAAVITTPVDVSTTRTTVIQTEIPVTRTTETTAPGWGPVVDTTVTRTTVDIQTNPAVPVSPVDVVQSAPTPVSPVDDVQLTRTAPDAVRSQPEKPQPTSSTSKNSDDDDDDDKNDDKNDKDDDKNDNNDKSDNNDDPKNEQD